MSDEQNSDKALTLVIQEVLSLFVEGIKQRFTNAYDALEPQLFNAARGTSDMKVKEEYLLAIETLAEKRQIISDNFFKLIQTNYNNFRPTELQPPVSQAALATNLDLSHLSLVDDNSLQEQISIEKVIAVSQRDCEYLLIPIASGLAKIFSATQVDKYANPLAPSRLGNWLQTSLSEADIAAIARSVIYHCFKEELFDTLAPLYKEVIDLFQKYSIELAMQRSKSKSLNMNTLNAIPVDLGFVSSSPDTERRRRVLDERVETESLDLSRNIGKFRRGLDEQVEVESSDSFSEIEDSISDLHEEIWGNSETSSVPNLILSDWLEQNQVPHRVVFDEGFISEIDKSFQLSDTEDNDDRTLISVSAKQLDAVLADIQLKMLQDETDWVSKLRQYLESRTNEHELCVIQSEHENILRIINHAMNIVCEVFHPSISRYLNSLRVAFARMAIADEAFLNDPLHPAKSLFDGLTHLCFGLNPSDKHIVKRLFRSIREIFEASLGEGPGIEKIRYDLLTFIAAEEHRSLSEKKATLQTLYTQQHRFLAFKTADAFIQNRYKTIPNILSFHKLLHDALRHVLAESFLNGGAGSDDWRLATKIFYSLVFTTQAAATEENKLKLVAGLPKLLDKLSVFFKKHGTPLDVQSLLSKQLKEIQSIILGGVDGSSLKDDALSETKTIQYLLDKIQKETKEHYKQKQVIGSEHHSSAPYAAMKEVKQPDLGQRFAYLVDDKILMCKYIYHFEPLDKLVFVNWEGQKLFERETQLVNQDIAKGYAKQLEHPIPIESAFRYVVKQLTDD